MKVDGRTGTSPEWPFVLACTRASLAGDGTSSVLAPEQLVGKGLDWDRVFDLASRHAVTPLVCQALSQMEANALPARVLTLVRGELSDCASRSLELTRGLIRLLDLLDANGISALPFKGPALASLLYGNVGLRDSSDLDILVRRDVLRRATELLLSHGYRTDLPPDAAKQTAYLSARYEVHLKAPDGRVDVELHQGFLAPYHSVPFDYDALWARLGRQRICGRDVLVMEREDLLAVLCVHGTKHAWARLGWICDVARLVVISEDLDWSTVAHRASALGVSRMLRIALLLAAKLLGADVPSEAMRGVEGDAAAHRLASRIAASLSSGDDGTTVAGEHLFFLQTGGSLRHTVAYLARLAFTPTEQDDVAAVLPALFSPLCYPLHALRVSGKYGRAFLRAHFKPGL